MQPTITPLDATLGATVTDLSLADLDEATWQQVEAAFHEFAVLIFPGQHLSAKAQVAFASRFGDIELLRANNEAKAIPVSNKKPDGSLFKPGDHHYQTLRGNEGWHTDSSYMPLAAKASMLSAQIVPSAGGETAWADSRAGYDALDDDKKAYVETLSAYHSLYQSQAKVGYEIKTGAGYGYHDKGAPLRPLVKTHPTTGRKSLFIGRHAYGIPGLSEEDSENLLTELLELTCQPPRTYFHSWQPGDLVIWDNRCALHAARPYDYNEVRTMRHTRIAGDPASELADTGPDPRANGFQPTASNR